MLYAHAIQLDPAAAPDKVLTDAWRTLGGYKLKIRQEDPQCWNPLVDWRHPTKCELRSINKQLDRIIDEMIYRQVSGWSRSRGEIKERQPLQRF